MANVTNSANMALPIPTVGVETGPEYASDVNASLIIIDGHTHSPGSGVQITPSGLNINSSLPINNNIISNIAALNLTPQLSQAANASVYASGVDLYFVDGNGNNIRITQSGSVAGSTGTITGLPSGTASASFAAATFTFQASTNTGANIDGASFVLRNNTALSKGLTLQPPNAMGSNYSLTLPSLPAQTNVMVLDVSGNMASITYDAVGQGMTSAGANPIANVRTRTIAQTTAPLSGIVYSVTSSGFTTAATAQTPVTGLTVTLTSSGRPIMLMLAPDTTASPASVSVANVSGSPTTVSIQLECVRDSVNQVGLSNLSGQVNSGGAVVIPPGAYTWLDIGAAAGTHAYQINVACGNINMQAQVFNVVLLAYEI